MNWQELVVYIILVLCFMTIILKHKFFKKLVFTKKQATEKVSCPNACPGCKCCSACSARQYGFEK